MVEIELTDAHNELAFHIAAARDLSARMMGRRPGHYTPHEQGTDGAFQINFDGARAEVAFWEATGREARINSVILTPDLRELDGDAVWRGKSLEIRSTEHENGHLIVYPDERPERFYVLCIAAYPFYRFPGYLRGQDAQIGAYLRNPDARGGKSYWIPQDHLSAWRGLGLRSG